MKKKLKGKGELIKCPKCGEDIVAGDREYIWTNEMEQDVYCAKCEQVYTETWKCVSWKVSK